MRFGFVTCVRLGLDCMEEIYAVGGRLDLAVTLLDDMGLRKSGRVWLDAFCQEHDIPLAKIRSINEGDSLSALRKARLDWLFIVGWSQIASSSVLAIPSRGALGMHPTLLPEGRGRAAIPWAILKGLDRTGVTLFQLDEGVDTGPILAQVPITVGPSETATALYGRVCEAHRSLIRRFWGQLEAAELVALPQDENAATVWPARRPEDGELLTSMTVAEADRLVRAVTRPYPGAFLRLGESILRVWAGRPAPSGDSTDAAARRLPFSDGDYLAEEYNFEASDDGTR